MVKEYIVNVTTLQKSDYERFDLKTLNFVKKVENGTLKVNAIYPTYRYEYQYNYIYSDNTKTKLLGIDVIIIIIGTEMYNKDKTNYYRKNLWSLDNGKETTR